jgi:hypothetical protein
MERFFFDSTSEPDLEGMLLPSLAAAQSVAARMLAEVAAKLPEGAVATVWIDVRNANRQRVLKVTLIVARDRGW